jgi:UTP--glucose-1-phosphate uridylyltransferase
MSASVFKQAAEPLATAVILVGGLGTRDWPASLATPKNLLPSQSRPLVLAAVDEAAEAGIQNVIIVSGPKEQALYQNLFSPKPELENDMAARKKFDALKILQDLAKKGTRIKYAIQKKPRGPGDAVRAARELVGNLPFAVIMPDDYFYTGKNPCCLAQMMAAYNQGKGGNIMCAMEVPEEDIGRYGIIEGRRDDDGSVFATDVTEKPTDIKLVGGSRMAIMGRDICQPEIMTILETLGPGAGGDVQLRDAQKILLRRPGQTFYGYHLTPERGLRLDYGTNEGRRDAEAVLRLFDNPGVIAQALAAARILAPDSRLVRFAHSAEARRLFQSSKC